MAAESDREPPPEMQTPAQGGPKVAGAASRSGKLLVFAGIGKSAAFRFGGEPAGRLELLFMAGSVVSTPQFPGLLGAGFFERRRFGELSFGGVISGQLVSACSWWQARVSSFLRVGRGRNGTRRAE